MATLLLHGTHRHGNYSYTDPSLITTAAATTNKITTSVTIYILSVILTKTQQEPLKII